MAILRGYFDDSGDEKDHGTIVSSLGGYMAELEQWQYFEKEWQAVLKKHDVPYLHMKEFAPFKKDFKKYKQDPDGRIVLLQDLMKVIKDSRLEGIVSRVNLNDLRYFNRHNKPKDRLNDYALNLYTCMWIISNRWPKKVVELYLDKTNNLDKKIVIAKTYAESDKYFNNKDYIQFHPINQHLTHKDILPLQAADLLAWEVRKDDTTDVIMHGDAQIWPKLSEHSLRKSFENLIISAPINSFDIWDILPLNMRKAGGHFAINHNKNVVFRWGF